MVEVDIRDITQDVDENWYSIFDVRVGHVDCQLSKANVAMHARVRLCGVSYEAYSSEMQSSAP